MVRWFRLLLLLLAGAALVVGYSFLLARADPVVRRATVQMPGWPAGAQPVRVVLASDLHLGSAAMTEWRLARLVRQIDALSPDLVLLAGDYINGHQPGFAAVEAPALTRQLRLLRARLGVVAVLGNHDFSTGQPAVRGALEAAGITVLQNQAVERGPLAIGGVADFWTGQAQVMPTVAAMRRLPGARVVLSHMPDITLGVPGDVKLVLAGHTHCGQILLPFYGPPLEVFNPRYRCGIVRDGARVTIVTAGLGTSRMPFRFRAAPDVWLVTLGPAPPVRRAPAPGRR